MSVDGRIILTETMGRIAQFVWRLITRWTVPGSNTSEGKIFLHSRDRPWCPLNLLYKGNWMSFPQVKWPRSGVDHPPPSRAEVQERVELYLYYYYYYYYQQQQQYSALGLVWAGTRAQSGDRCGSGMLHPGQVLTGSLPLLSPDIYIFIYKGKAVRYRPGVAQRVPGS